MNRLGVGGSGPFRPLSFRQFTASRVDSRDDGEHRHLGVLVILNLENLRVEC